MNRGQAKGIVEHAELVRAFSEGKDIQYKTQNGDWRATDNPLFTEGIQYRIKPKPRVMYAVQSCSSDAIYGTTPDKDAAHRMLDSRATPSLWELVEYVEVVK